MPRDASRLFGDLTDRATAPVKRAAAQRTSGGMKSTLPPRGTATPAAPVQRQGALDAYAAYVGSQSFATPQAPPSGKYRGFANQGQLYAAIQGGADEAWSAAQQYASEMRGAADTFGRKTADEAAMRQREAQQAWQDAQRKAGAQRKAMGQERERAIESGRKLAGQEWLKGFDIDSAQQYGMLDRGTQAASQRYAAMAGQDALPVSDISKTSDGDEWDRYVSEVATQMANRSASPDVMAVRSGDRASAGLLGRAARGSADEAAARLGGFEMGAGDTPTEAAGFSMADYMKDLQGAVNPRLEAARTARDASVASASTPVSEYAQMIGSNVYGLDPWLLRGQFDEGLDISRFKEERDAGAIAEFGMPFSEYQSAQTRAMAAEERAQAQAANEAEAQTQAQLDELASLVTAQTGMDAGDLANRSALPIEALGQVLATPDYQTANSQLGTALSTGDEAAFDQTLGNLAQYDPQLFRVLQAQYADYVDSSFDPLDDTTWRQG